MKQILTIILLLFSLSFAYIDYLDDGTKVDIQDDSVKNLTDGTETTWAKTDMNHWLDSKGNTWVAISEQVYIMNGKYIYTCNPRNRDILDYRGEVTEKQLQGMVPATKN